MRDVDFTGGFVCGALLVLAVLVLVLVMAKPRLQFEKEAVHHGAARWIVDDEGRREFVWNESGVRDGE